MAVGSMLAGCQIQRVLILHKVLEADDGEKTRTRKMRRKMAEEKFADLIAAVVEAEKAVAA